MLDKHLNRPFLLSGQIARAPRARVGRRLEGFLLVNDILQRAAETALALVDHQTPCLPAAQRARHAERLMAGLLDAVAVEVHEAVLRHEIHQAMRSGKAKP